MPTKKGQEMKIIFLDFDGVLNNPHTFDLEHGRMMHRTPPGETPTLNMRNLIDPDMLRRILMVIAETGARVVISSTWRKFLMIPPDDKILSDTGLDIALHHDWRTGEHANGHRGCEIAEWLNNHPETEKYIIIDDDSDMLEEQIPYHVHTNMQLGFTAHDAKKAVALLGRTK